ncbi:MAG TPA: DUF4236 domain-containing protein [Rhizomicrobium sp.]|nr:DUF4236 domain-containing protein [Rhizomicrobium sp.]
MGLRFQRVLRIFPWLRINVSKGGVSGSVGPRGADINIGRHGVTTNAGIPGTGISYRSKLGSHGSKIGVLALVAALGFAAFKNADRLTSMFQHPPTSVAAATKTLTASKRELAAQTVADAATLATGIRYVHRGGSDLRETPMASGRVLKKESKGVQVALLSVWGPWAQVRDGNITGWMRASVLGEDPPKP